MEILAELVVQALWLLLELVVDLVVEILLEVGLTVVKETLGRSNRRPFTAAVGYFVLGAVVGALSTAVWPGRVTRRGLLPGFSLLAAPLALGGVMEAWGRWRRDRGHGTTNLATFYGGAAFAFGVALVRFVRVK